MLNVSASVAEVIDTVAELIETVAEVVETVAELIETVAELVQTSTGLGCSVKELTAADVMIVCVLGVINLKENVLLIRYIFITRTLYRFF